MILIFDEDKFNTINFIEGINCLINLKTFFLSVGSAENIIIEDIQSIKEIISLVNLTTLRVPNYLTGKNN